MDPQPRLPEEDRPRLIGDPVREVRAGFALSSAAARAMLLAPSLPKLLDLLEVPSADRDLLLGAREAVAGDPAVLAAITDCANLVRERAGRDVPAADLRAHADAWDELQQAVSAGRGLIALLGCAIGTDVVRAWHAQQGLSAAQSWSVLGALGGALTGARPDAGRALPGLVETAEVARIWAGALPAVRT